MASTAQNNLKGLTASNQGIDDLRELIFTSILEFGSINEVLDIYQGVRDGKIIGGIGEFDLVGEATQLCNPTFNSTKLNTLEKKWELGALGVAEKICAEDFLNTVVKFCMKTGTQKADLSETDLLAHIIHPRLSHAIEKAMWRYLWFGDKDALNQSEGGLLANNIDKKYFTAVNGLFKRLFAITAANPEQRITIAANAETTKENQRNKLKENGVALDIFDKLIYDAPMRLRQKSDRLVICTQSYGDALARDIKQNNIGSGLQWESLFGGMVYASEFNGEKIVSIPLFDEMIGAYEDQGTTLNKPHRVIYTSKTNLLGGIESANSFMPELDIWFSKDSQETKIIGREEVGTQILEDDLIQFAY